MNEKELIKRKENDWEITDLLWEVVRRWRLILVCTLIGAVILAGYQLVKDMKAAKATPEQVQVEQERTIEEMEQALGTQDLDEVLGAVAMRKQLDEKSTYSKESALMQINPYAENVVYLQYYAIGDLIELDYASIFKQHITSSVYASELIDVETGGRTVYMMSDGDYASMDSNVDNNKNSFVVRVRGLSEEECMETAELIKADLKDYVQKLGTNISGISLTLIEENAVVIVDEELVYMQNQTATMIKQLNNNLDSLKSNMTGDQLALYVQYTDLMEQEAADSNENVEADNEVNSEAEITTSTEVSVHLSITKLVIGAIIGLILAILWILLSFLVSAKLRSETEIKTLYRVNVLGSIRSGKKNGIDRQIMKWRYHRSGTLTLEQEVDLISANIKIACGNDNTDVYLTGSDMESMPKEILEKLVATCKEKGVSVVIGKEISYHADALEKMAEVGRVLFVEQIRNSYCDEIYKEVIICMEHEIPVMGMIVIGA